MQEQLRALLSRHCTTINGQVDTIKRSLREVCDSKVDQAASIKNALEITHQIKGTSGSMGYLEVSAAAARLEQGLKSLETVDGQFSAGQLQAALDLLAALEHQASNTTPEMSSLYSAVLSRLNS